MHLYTYLLEYQYVKPKVTKVSCYRAKLWRRIFFVENIFSFKTLYYYCNYVTFIYIYIIYNNLQVTNRVTSQVTNFRA